MLPRKCLQVWYTAEEGGRTNYDDVLIKFFERFSCCGTLTHMAKAKDCHMSGCVQYTEL